MPVDTRPLIKPAFILCSIYPNGEDIIVSVTNIVRNITGESAVTAGVVAKIKTVYPDLAVAKDPIETDHQPFAGVGDGNDKMFSVPAYAGGGVMTTNGFIAMR